MTTKTPPPPDTVDLAQCKHCGSTIRFVYLENGRRVPVNPEPASREGTGRLVARYEAELGFYATGYFVAASDWVAFDMARFTPHSDTCGKRHERRHSPAKAAAIAEIRAALAAAKAQAD